MQGSKSENEPLKMEVKNIEKQVEEEESEGFPLLSDELDTRVKIALCTGNTN